jgi:hypothetical protein
MPVTAAALLSFVGGTPASASRLRFSMLLHACCLSLVLLEALLLLLLPASTVKQLLHVLC